MDATVEQLVKSAELQAQAMQIVAQDTDTLAAVSLMDLSVEAEAFGANVRFSPDEVPAVTGQLVADEDDAEALQIPDLDQGRARICAEGIRLAKERITDKPVLAGMIGPYSLAGRLMDVTEIMYICFDEPETVHMVLDKATEYLIRYGQSLKDAGADGIMMAEPLAGILSPDMAAEFSVPYVKRIIEALQDDEFAVLYHNCGNSVSSMLEEIFSHGRRRLPLRQRGRHEGSARERARGRAVHGQHRPGKPVCNGHARIHDRRRKGPARAVRRIQELRRLLRLRHSRARQVGEHQRLLRSAEGLTSNNLRLTPLPSGAFPLWKKVSIPMNYEELIRAAKENGAAKAAVIPQSKIILSPTFREICAGNGCGNYGRCWMCPPYVGEIDALIEKVRSYPYGLLYQTIGEIEDSFDIEGMFDCGRDHALVSQQIQAAVKPLLGEGFLHLTCGGCRLCERCAKADDEPCRFPEKALPSLESYGVDVFNTAKGTDLKYINGENTVTYFGMVLFTEAENG